MDTVTVRIINTNKWPDNIHYSSPRKTLVDKKMDVCSRDLKNEIGGDNWYISSSGKPQVDGKEFNISHDGGYVVIAEDSGNKPVGIDIVKLESTWDGDWMDYVIDKYELDIVKEERNVREFGYAWAKAEAQYKRGDRDGDGDIMRFEITNDIIGTVAVYKNRKVVFKYDEYKD